MDKKAKKRIDLLQQRLQKLRQQLHGAKQQMDEPDEVRRIEKEIVEVSVELEKLKAT
jgi:predicted  nucleic acid-binding Zn-ribbon protein